MHKKAPKMLGADQKIRPFSLFNFYTLEAAARLYKIDTRTRDTEIHMRRGEPARQKDSPLHI